MSVVGEERRLILQAVGEICDTELASPWEADEPRVARLICIGLSVNLAPPADRTPASYSLESKMRCRS